MFRFAFNCLFLKLFKLFRRSNGQHHMGNQHRPSGKSCRCSAHSWTGPESARRRIAKLLACKRSQKRRTDLKEACSWRLYPLHDVVHVLRPALTEVIVDACVAQIHSLVRKPEHNGKIARLLDYSRETDRWVKYICSSLAPISTFSVRSK